MSAIIEAMKPERRYNIIKILHKINGIEDEKLARLLDCKDACDVDNPRKEGCPDIYRCFKDFEFWTED